MKLKEIKQALGKQGRIIARDKFREEYARAGFPYGRDFAYIVGFAVNTALQTLRYEGDRVECDKFNANTADSVAHWIDRD